MSGLPVVTEIQVTAWQVHCKVGYRQKFKAQGGWITHFKKQKEYSLWWRTSTYQKLPANFNKKLQAFLKFAILLIKQVQHTLGHTINLHHRHCWNKASHTASYRRREVSDDLYFMSLKMEYQFQPSVVFKWETFPKKRWLWSGEFILPYKRMDSWLKCYRNDWKKWHFASLYLYYSCSTCKFSKDISPIWWSESLQRTDAIFLSSEEWHHSFRCLMYALTIFSELQSEHFTMSSWHHGKI